MLTAIALTKIWDDAQEKIIPKSKIFRMSNSRIMSLVAIKAAAIILEEKSLDTEEKEQQD